MFKETPAIKYDIIYHVVGEGMFAKNERTIATNDINSEETAKV